MSSYRDEALAKWGELYSLFRPGKYGAEYYTCTYCGDPADTIDHQPPITRVSDYRCFGLLHELYITVPCCAECNSLLSDELTQDLFEREVILKNRLARKYRKKLKLKIWSKDDLNQAQIIGNLRKRIAGFSRVKARIESRLDYEDGIRAFLMFLRERDIPLTEINENFEINGTQSPNPSTQRPDSVKRI